MELGGRFLEIRVVIGIATPRADTDADNTCVLPVDQPRTTSLQRRYRRHRFVVACRLDADARDRDACTCRMSAKAVANLGWER